MSFRPFHRMTLACSLLLALQACKAQVPDRAYRCKTDAECMPELPYCDPVSTDGDHHVCSSSRRTTRADASSPEHDSAVSGTDAAGHGADAAIADDAGSGTAGSDANEAGVTPPLAGTSGGDAGVPISPPSATKLLQEAAYIKADRAQAQRQFGSSLAVRGTLLVVGAPFDDVAETMVRHESQAPAPASDARQDTGAAYVYRLIDGQWTFEACLAVPNRIRAEFARSVAIDEAGERIVVGVAREGELLERVYLYARDSKDKWVAYWSQGLVNPPGAGGFGAAVAIHGDVLVVAAPDEDVSAVYIYTLGDDWSSHAPPLRLTAPMTTPQSQSPRFGNAVAIWGDMLVVGAPYYDRNYDQVLKKDAGGAFLFRRDPMTRQWSTTASSLLSPNPDHHDNLGFAVAIDDQYVAAGAPGTQPWVNGEWDVDRREDEGAVHLFRVGTGVYEGTARPDGEDTIFGRMGSSAALDGTLLLAGAPGLHEKYAGTGKAYLFRRDALQKPAAVLSPSLGDLRDEFGAAVGLSGGLAVVGSSGEDSSATGLGGDARDNSSEDNGAAYAFTLD